MPEDLPLPPWMDRTKAARIAQLRALGYTQAQIANELGVSQQTVSRYLKVIHEAAAESNDLEQFIGALIIAGLSFAGLMWLLSKLQGSQGPPRG